MNTFKLFHWIGLLGKGALSRSSSSGPSDRRSRGASVDPRTSLQFFVRLFLTDVTFKREGKGLKVRLAAAPAVAPPPTPVDEPIGEALAMHAALKTLLDSHAMTRRVMRHLALFEGALATDGMKITAEMPLDVLSSAAEQLEALVGNWSNSALAELHSKMAVAIVTRSRDPFYGPAGEALSNFNTNSRLLVGDASHSAFLELERQYRGLLPAQSIQAVLDPIKVEFANAVQAASDTRSK